MIIRQLEAHEFGRLDGHVGLGGISAPRLADYIVAEDDHGNIRAFWSVIMVPHVEPIWIDEEFRSTTLAGRLWKALRAYLDKVQVPVVYSFAASRSIAAYLSRLGFVLQPYLTYTYTSCPLPLPKSVSLSEETS